jgi:hypothetical protein
MRLILGLLLTATFLVLFGCESKQSRRTAVAPADSEKHADKQQGQLAQLQTVPQAKSDLNQPATTNVSFDQANAANEASQAIDRKIIRNGNLTVEVASPIEGQRKISSIAESHGGFVVTSEMTQQTSEDNSKPSVSVNLVVRVPATQFDSVVQEIRAAGSRVLQEKRTGQDVTEEFIDLEARIKNQRALETQFLEIMKRAGKVEEALEVQSQLAEVRTEIEKLEGRKRFLENQASLSTINVTLQTPTQIVNAVGFWYNVKSAFADGVDVAAAIVLFLIRAIIALLPVLVLIVLPVALITKVVIMRMRRRRTMTSGQEVEAAA